ncbi:hypothetical protein EV424DRAFT_1375745 [Suillus variegatus]|nr:hypothetical protein EV424DRAFT_1375745 [Suillus variegatus]
MVGISLTLHLSAIPLAHILCPAGQKNDTQRMRHTQDIDNRIRYSNIAYNQIQQGHERPALSPDKFNLLSER